VAVGALVKAVNERTKDLENQIKVLQSHRRPFSIVFRKCSSDKNSFLVCLFVCFAFLVFVNRRLPNYNRNAPVWISVIHKYECKLGTNRINK
jgi:hypothetical protein